MPAPAPTPSPAIRGRFVWYELMTTDPSAAKEFYTKALGWGHQKWEGPMDYSMWTLEGTPVGGVMTLPEEARTAGAPPHWMAYVGTPDVDATIARAQEIGGSVAWPAMDVPTVGRMAGLRDPQGAMFAIYAPAEEPQPEADAVPGRVSWHELATTDFEAAARFYGDLFGWEKAKAHDMGPLGIYQEFGRGGRMLVGMFNKPAEMPFPPHWLLYVMVDSVEEAVARITKGGGKILNGPMPVPGGDMIAQCLDPQGAAFAIHAKAKA